MPGAFEAMHAVATMSWRNGRAPGGPASRRRPAGAAILTCGLLLVAGCVEQPLILGEETTRRVREFDLETPPVARGAQAIPLPSAARDAADGDRLTPPVLAATESPVTLPEAKVTPGPARLEVALPTVRAAALEHNLDIEVELVRPEIFRESTREAEARFEPWGFATYSRNSTDLPLVGNARAPDDTRTDSAEIGIQVPLQTGGTASISMPVTRTDLRTPGIDDIYDTGAALSLTQPLLRNAGVLVNTAPITIARLSERQQDARTKLAILNVLANAERTYWNLYAAARSVAVRLEQHERAQLQEHQAIRLAQEGVVPAIEVTRARAGVARRIEDIIVAENFRRRTERELKRVMNRPELPVASSTALIATTEPDPRELVMDAKLGLETAYTNRMELLDLELQMAIDSLSVDVAKNQKLPALAFDYSFRYLGADTGFEDSLAQIADTRHVGHSAGLSLVVPLGNAARRANFNRAVLQRTLTQTTIASQRQFVERQVFDTIDQVSEAWQRILAAREDALMAATNYRAEQRQFLVGARTSTDVLQAADYLAEAQLREVRALASYEIAKIDLAFVTGTLLGTGRVSIEPFGARRSAAPTAVDDRARIDSKLSALGVDDGAAAGSQPVPAATVPRGQAGAAAAR
jgi:outer membrane protein TolC